MAILIEGTPHTTERDYQIIGASEKVKRQALSTWPLKQEGFWFVETRNVSGEVKRYTSATRNNPENSVPGLDYTYFRNEILPELQLKGGKIQSAELWITYRIANESGDWYMSDGLSIYDTIDLIAPRPTSQKTSPASVITEEDTTQLSDWMKNLKNFRDEESAKKAAIAPAHISSRVLRALGGKKEIVNIKGQDVSLINDGAYLWGEEDRDKGKGILNHVLLTRRTALTLARTLKEKQAPGFEDINLDYVADAATLHDVTKLYGEDREKLTPEQKAELGLPENFREIMDEVDGVGVEWLRKLGFPVEVYRAIMGHDFPLSIVDDPYWKIVLVADYMSGQQIMTVDERLNDVKTRWIDQQIVKGEKPRIEPERFAIAQQNIKTVAAELFDAIGMDDTNFIDINHLNSPDFMDRGERFIRRTAETRNEDRVKRAIGLVERVAGSGNYGKIGYSEWRRQNPKDKTAE